MQITCPEGVCPGQEILVSTPDGAQLETTVPEGVAPGAVFLVTHDRGLQPFSRSAALLLTPTALCVRCRRRWRRAALVLTALRARVTKMTRKVAAMSVGLRR